MTYTELDQQLQGRNRERRKLANNTYAERRGEGEIAIRLHKTDILTFKKDETVVVNTGGWKTVTTKDRINRYLPGNFSLYQSKNIWYWHFADRCGFSRNGDKPYSDGDQIVCVSGNYELLTKVEKPDDSKQRELLKRIDTYAKLYGKALPLDRPSGGDCWGCHLGGTHDSLGKDHLVTHMDDGYVVPSLAYNAMKERGAGPAWYWTVFKGEDGGDKQRVFEKIAGRSSLLDSARKEIVRWVRRYMRRRLGLVS